MELERQIIVGGDLLKITRIAACVSGSGLFRNRLRPRVIIVLVVATAIISPCVTASSGGITLWTRQNGHCPQRFQRLCAYCPGYLCRCGFESNPAQPPTALCGSICIQNPQCLRQATMSMKSVCRSAPDLTYERSTASVKLVTATSLAVWRKLSGQPTQGGHIEHSDHVPSNLIPQQLQPELPLFLCLLRLWGLFLDDQENEEHRR